MQKVIGGECEQTFAERERRPASHAKRWLWTEVSAHFTLIPREQLNYAAWEEAKTAIMILWVLRPNPYARLKRPKK